ncbi:hypothetical protein T552_02636 [Pneumocystis carinii B80]|uniref:YAG7-like dimerisation domain-containing protein n=1 Tax=Pneumocystis carinii (strain B80) TaxID=1408658 RepID=A0A0W4ZE33_PNEC8|nr:hypothetical protein T552_02636 [Pneumocystis carinii B80]KTW26627.1 hypothetical protein T552_02636 [Pneumocystis carinii B80]
MGQEDRSEYSDILYKRLRTYHKKKQRLERLQEKFEGPEREKLNKDQLALLQNKDQVLYPLKELEELWRQFSLLMEQEKEVKEKEIERAKEIAMNEAQEKKEEKEQIRTLVRFLKYASLTRHTPTNDIEYNQAVEKVLQMLYKADENSIQVVEKLYEGSEEQIEECERITYKYMKEQIEQKAEEIQKTVEYKLEESPRQQKMSSYNLQESLEQMTFNKLSKVVSPCNKKSGGPYERINFLNESEIEGLSLKDPLTTNYTRGSMDTLTNVLYNHYPVNNNMFSATSMTHYHEMQNPTSVSWKEPRLNHQNTSHWNTERRSPLTNHKP